MSVSRKKSRDEIQVPSIKHLLPAQLDVLEAQLARQEDAMRARIGQIGTRASVLIAASAFLGGAGIVTASSAPWVAGVALCAFLVAALCGVLASRSRLGREPDLVDSIEEFAEFATVSLRRDVLLRRLQAHDNSVTQLNSRHRWLVAGVVVLAVAWSATAASTFLGVLQPADRAPLVVEITSGEEER